jgi:hypothetical protein
MMRPWTAAFILLLTCASLAAAQTTDTAQRQTTPAVILSAMPPEPEGFTLTPFVGVGFGGDFNNGPTGFGLAVGYGLTHRVVVEGEFAYTPNGEPDFCPKTSMRTCGR